MLTSHYIIILESVKDAAGQLTEATIARHSQMVGVGKVIKNVYHHQVASVERSMIQTSTRPSRENDISVFVELMLEEQIFMTVPGRKFKSFPDTSMVLFRKIQSTTFGNRLIRLRKKLSKQAEIMNQMQT